MTDNQRYLLWTMIVASLLFIVVPLIVFIARRIVFSIKGYKAKKSAQLAKGLLAFSAMMLCSVWLMRMAAEVYLFVYDGYCLGAFAWWDKSLECIIHTLQTFSLDESYTEYLEAGKNMMYSLTGGNGRATVLFSGYNSLLNVLAPLAGGAIIFDILSGIFPMIKLFFSHLAFWNTKYYFSELNERALALASSICETEKKLFKRPVIIFTESQSCTETDNGAELIYKAKLIGAICVPDDIINITKNRFGPRKYMLIADNEMENLQSFTGLASERTYKCLKNAEVYLFSQDDMYILVEKQVREYLKDKISEKEFPIIVPVQGDRNLATNLIDDLPLFEPIINKKRDEQGLRDLTVTIFGAGKVGNEMFMASYWSGQMLDVRLNINVVSLESEEEFNGRLDYINPEIRRSAIEGDRVLAYNKKGDCSHPYCTVSYFSMDAASIHMSEILKCVSKNEKTLYNTDYFIVCLGSDELNIAVANKLSQTVGAYHLSSKENIKAVVSYVVRDSELCEMLNVKNSHNFSLHNGDDLYMYAFGSLDEVYSTRNIFMRDFELKAVSARGSSTESEKYKKELCKIHKERAKDDYSYWSHLARSRHVQYKIFSSGLYTKSIFDKDHANERVLAKEKYKTLIYGKDHDLELMHRLSWLEHRRWCAFIRVRGFVSTDKYEDYYESLGSHKNMPLKLHPCLVEADYIGMKAEFDEMGRAVRQLIFEEDFKGELDELDIVSRNVRKFKKSQKDYKYYDYPVEDFRELKR